MVTAIGICRKISRFHRALKAGYTLQADTSIPLGHVGTYAFTWADVERAFKAGEAASKADAVQDAARLIRKGFFATFPKTAFLDARSNLVLGDRPRIRLFNRLAVR